MSERLASVEDYSKRDRIIPIFGKHLVGDNSDLLVQFLDVLSIGEFPTFSSWDNDVVKKLNKMKPRFIAVDTFSYDPKKNTDRFESGDLFYFPGNPFNLRIDNKDVYIVSADFPAVVSDPRKLPKLVSLSESAVEAIVENAIGKFYETSTGLKASDESNKRTSRQLIYSTTGAVEVVLSAGAGIKAAEHIKENPLQLSRRDFIRYSAISLAGISNCARTMSYLFGESTNINKPFMVALEGLILDDPDNIIRLRNAVVSIKLNEAQSLLLTDDAAGGKKTVVFGTAHRKAEGIMNKGEEQIAIIAASVLKVINNLEINDENLSGKERVELRRMLLDRIAEVFGGVAIWSVKESPKILTPETVINQIPMNSCFISPAIKKIVDEVASSVGFLRGSSPVSV